MTELVRSTDGTAIAYEADGAGPALVLVGGAFSTRESMRPLAELLRERFTTVVLDRRGRGDSGPTTWVSAEQQVDDLLAVAAATGAGMVFGHSSGGVLALLAGARSPGITRLAVYEPPLLVQGGPDPEASSFAAELRTLLAAGQAEEATRAWFVRTTGGRFDDRMRALPWWPALVALARTLPDETALTGDGSLPAGLDAVSASTLVVVGGESHGWAAASAIAVAEALPRGEVVSLAGQDHMVEFDVLAPVLARFFTG